MKVGIIGHPEKVKKIKSVLEKHDPLTELCMWELSSEEKVNVELFNHFLKEVDWILFGGIYDYICHSKFFDSHKIVGYIKNDDSSLYLLLLRILLKNETLSNISIDGYSKENLVNLCEEIGVDFHVLFKNNYYKIATHDVNFEIMDKIYQFHKMNCSKRTDVIITCMTPVFEKLTEEGKDVYLVRTTEQNIKSEYERMTNAYLLSKNQLDEIAVLELKTSFEINADVLNDQITLSDENLIILKSIYLFSQGLQCSVDMISLNHFLLITTRQNLEAKTNFYNDFLLLRELKPLANSKISIGVGYGSNMTDIRNHAIIAVNMAEKEDVSCVYIMFSENDVYGPIKYNGIEQDQNELESYCRHIAEETKISMNSIKKILKIHLRHREQLFTVRKLAELYGVSEKTMYKLISKLETGGYIIDRGYQIQNDKGRPSRKFKMNFDI